MTAPSTSARLLTAVVCGAGPASHVAELVELAHGCGWAVGLVATPAALPFVDVPKLEDLTGGPIRSEYRDASTSGTRVLPDARAVVVAPATYNTICKLANGVSDTYALGVLAEAIGRGVPVAVLPFVNTALASRKPFAQAVASLRTEGVRVLLGPGEWEPHPPGSGGDRLESFPWRSVLDAVGVCT